MSRGGAAGNTAGYPSSDGVFSSRRRCGRPVDRGTSRTMRQANNDRYQVLGPRAHSSGRAPRCRGARPGGCIDDQHGRLRTPQRTCSPPPAPPHCPALRKPLFYWQTRSHTKPHVICMGLDLNPEEEIGFFILGKSLIFGNELQHRGRGRNYQLWG